MLWDHTVVYAHYDRILVDHYFLIGFVDFFWYHFNISIVILVQGSFNIGPRLKMEVHLQYCNDPLSGLSESSSESIIMIPEIVHKTYYKKMLKNIPLQYRKKI